MKLERFNRKKVKAGDLLVLAQYRRVRVIFRFIGHDGDVVARWIDPEPGLLKDVVLRQRDVLMVVAE